MYLIYSISNDLLGLGDKTTRSIKVWIKTVNVRFWFHTRDMSSDDQPSARQ